MATAIAVIELVALVFLAFVLWGTVRHNERMRDEHAAFLAEERRAWGRTCADNESEIQTLARAARISEQKLAKAERELTDARLLHEAQRAERKGIIADMQQNYGARVATDAQVQYAASLVPLMERTAEALVSLAAQSNQREANLRNDVEAERVLAAKSLDSLTQCAAHLVTLSTEMAGLQRIGFRPPMKETETPKDSVVVGLPSVEDVDRELMEDHPEMAARYD
jgi:hypothetical protein